MTSKPAILTRLSVGRSMLRPCALVTVAGALALAFLPLPVAVALVLGIGLVVLVLVRVEYGLWLVILAVPFGSLREFQWAGFTLSLADLLLGLLVASWLMGLAARRRESVAWGPLSVALLPFAALMLLSMTTAIEQPPAVKELIKWLELIAVYVVVINTVRDWQQARRLMAAIFVAGSAEALLGYYQFFARVGPPSFAIGPFLRAYGTFEQPNPYAGYLGMVLPLAVGLAFTWRGDQALWLKMLAIVTAGLVGTALAMSLSRGAWLGFGAALAVMAALASRRALAILLGGAIVVVTVLLLGSFDLLPASVAGRLATTLAYFRLFDARQVAANAENWALVERMAHWQAAWEMYQEHPVLGVGVGNYVAAYPVYALPGWKDPLGHAHNYYLNTLAEMGFLGLGAYLAVLATWFWHVKNALGRCWPLPFARAALLGVLGVLVAVSVHNFFDNLYVHSMNMHIAAILGLATAMGRMVTKEKQVAVPGKFDLCRALAGARCPGYQESYAREDDEYPSWRAG